MKLFYPLIYNPLINSVLRSIFLGINTTFKTNLIFPLTGTIKLPLKTGEVVYLELNESSPGHIYYWERPDNYEYTNIFIHLMKNSKVFFDIGANIGYYTCFASAANKDVKVYSFEPGNGAHYYLSKNIKLNNAQNTQLFKLALSDQNGSINFYELYNVKYPYLEHFLSGTNATQNTFNRANVNEYEVPTRRLDDFVKEQNLECLDVIKIDTEGTEQYILAHATETITKFQPIVICEVLPGKIEKEIEVLVKKWDYLIYQHLHTGLKPVSSLENLSNDIDRNCFFVPQSKKHLIEKFII